MPHLILSPALRSSPPFLVLARLMLSGLLLLMLPALSLAQEAASLQARAHALKLADTAGWRLLLKVPLKGGASQVLSPDFFLSARGRDDAAAELDATLAALLSPFEDEDRDARCRFPARRQWLGEQLGVREWLQPEPRCTRLLQWLDFSRLRRVSVSLVSGYFGNPASAFGHALLRFETERQPGDGALGDLTLNFGALVPAQENMLRYVAKGLAGGYDAGFSDKDYAEHDQVYVRGENRDIWHYELALAPAQAQLLALHAREISGRKFQYFFLSRNCAWRLAEMLELVLPVSLREGSDEAWYIPVELFGRLEAAQAAGQPVYRQVQFQASAQRELLGRLRQLAPRERQAFSPVLINEGSQLAADLEGLDPPQAQRVIEVLLEWTNWKNPTGQVHDEMAVVERLKKRLLQARLRLPTGASNLLAPAALPSPGRGTAPQRWSLGLQWDGRHALQPALRWTAAAFELQGFHGLAAGELQVADLHWQRLPQGNGRVQSLTLLSARKLNDVAESLPGERDMAWQLRLGWQRDHGLGGDGLRAGLRAGLGHAWRFAGLPALQAFSMLDLQLWQGADRAGLEPSLGLSWQSADWHGLLEWRRRSFARDGRSHQQLQAELLYRLARQQVLSMSLASHPARVGLAWERFH